MTLSTTLYDLVLNSACRSNHHRIAMMALTQLRGPDSDAWRALFLHHYEDYLAGATAPDTVFKEV
jgi:hypothetical protein